MREPQEDSRRATAIGGLAAACIALVALAGHQAGLDDSVVETVWAPRMSPGTALIVALLAFTMASSKDLRQTLSAVAAVAFSASTLALWATSEPPVWMADPTTALLGLAVGFAVLVARQPGAATLLGVVAATIGGLLLLGIVFADPLGGDIGTSGTTVPTVAAFVALAAGWGVRQVPTDDPMLRVLVPGLAVTGGLVVSAAAVTTAMAMPIEWRATLVAMIGVIGAIGTGVAVAQRALRTTDALMHIRRALVRETSHAMLLIRHDGIVETANDAAQHLFGRTAGRILGSHVDSLMPPGSSLVELIARQGRGEDVDTSFEILRPDSERRQVRVHCTELPQPEGPAIVAVALTDVTELALQAKHAEARADALQSALDREIEAMDRLRELDEAKDLLITAMSHEVRTPLTVLLGVADLLTNRTATLDPAMQEQLLHRMARQARKLAQLVDDLVDVDQSKERPVFTVAELVRVDMVARDVAERANREFDRRVVVDVPPTTAYVDPRHLNRILASLVSNACKYAPIGPVHIDGDLPDGEGFVHIAVEDHGQGIPLDRREAIFQPFERGTLLDQAQPGIGIGLAIVRRLCEANGGEVWAEEGGRTGGARLLVKLPTGTRAATPSDNGDGTGAATPSDNGDGTPTATPSGNGDGTRTAAPSGNGEGTRTDSASIEALEPEQSAPRVERD